MVIATQYLFKSFLRDHPVDCVCDIGSRDGEDSIIFKGILPESEIIAFEANEINYKKMLKDQLLIENKIQIFPYAISDCDGSAYLNILDPDDTQSLALKGMSSLLERLDYPNPEKKLVETKRLDNFINIHFPLIKSLCLWIDVEGNEYKVIEGISGLKEKIITIHVETAIRPLLKGQQSILELDLLLNRFGFKRIGKDFKSPKEFGNAIYISTSFLKKLKYRLFWYKLKAVLAKIIAGNASTFLKKSIIYSFIKKHF